MRNDNAHGYVNDDVVRFFGRHAQIKAEDTDFQGASQALVPSTRNHQRS